MENINNNSVQKMIFFDIDDTIFCTSDFARDNRNKCFYKLIELGIGMSFDEIHKRFYEIEKEYGPNFNEHFNVLIHERNLSKRKSVEMLAQVVTSYHMFKNKICKYKFLGVDFILKKLQEKGFTLGVITHGVGVKQWDKLIRLGIDKYFLSSNIYITGTLGYNQKYEEFYEEIYEKYSSRFDEIYMMGDNENSDILPSKEVGFKTIRVSTGDIGSINFEESLADYKIKSISDIFDIHELFDINYKNNKEKLSKDSLISN